MSRRITRIATGALIIAALGAPAASARPIDPPVNDPFEESSTPIETVVRTVVKEEEAVRALPIALAGAALIIAIAGTGYSLVRIAPVRQQLRGQH
jgi:hypothetical protein